MLVLVLNPGSSSLKYQLRKDPSPANDPDILLDCAVEGPPARVAIAAAFNEIYSEVHNIVDERPLDAIGHRVVHGGERFTGPVLVTGDVMAAIEDLAPLAPLHNAASAACMRAAASRWPGTPQVAVFDTAFHRTLPEHAFRYALPKDLLAEHPIRRYGFHGISVERASRDTASFLRLPAWSLNAIVAHLGSGASVTAVRDGRSVDTSMGMTPVEGLVMGTRSGDLDPSIVTLLQRRGLGPDEVDELLNQRSGLLGLSGSADMRTVQDAAQHGDPAADLALDMAAYRLAKYIAGYNMVVGGAHALVFTGAIGEHSGPFRSRVLSWLAPLGLGIDEGKNCAPHQGIRVISSTESTFPVLVVPCDEERAIAEAAAALLDD
ncbi:acetate/propionate family kinase [Arthrobacter sp. R-11]|uniref:acetate/propionate family kinase n=1 Tax=Arthrobacter sp. R-11 TaxID=3404053 RepID=UPI003CF33620